MTGPSSLPTRIAPQLTANALEVLRARYLRKNDRGQITETPAEMFARVARHVAEVERQYGGDASTAAEQFYDAMAQLEFLPNSPALMNAGTRVGQLAACFVLPIDDSLDSIFGSLRDAARVHQTGGGVGYDFSRLRPKGDAVASTGGASRHLATIRGAYPAFAESRDGAVGASPVRNATRLAIAPTGTLSLIAGCSSGIEPLFAVAYARHVLEGQELIEVNTRFEARVRREGAWSPDLCTRMLESGRVRDLMEVPPAVRRVFPTAHEISAEHQLRVQAVFQAHVDNAVSKTINLPADATVSDVLEAYQHAFLLGCKGITVYRHGAKAGQVLTPVRKSSVCPDCLTTLEFSEGVALCRACGFSSTS